MKITAVKAVPLSHVVPPERRQRSDLGTRMKNDSTLIMVQTDEGLTGLGAALGNPEVVRAIVDYELGPNIVGMDPMFSERIYEYMYNGERAFNAVQQGWATPPASRRRGMVMEALSGIDLAVWDVKAQALGIPIYKALGAVRDSIRGYASGGWAPGEESEREMAGYAAKGFTAVKMRVVGHDGFSLKNAITRIKAARRGIGPDVELFIDAHGAFDVATAIKVAKAVEEFDISWFEEPISPDDHPGLGLVRQATSIPIATGEREFTRFDFIDLLRHNAIDIAQPDIGRAGGFTEIRRIAAITSAHQIRLAPHAWSNGALFAASIHLALHCPNCFVLECSQAHMPMMYELFNEPFDIRPDGMVFPPDRPGLGFTLRKDVFERFKYVPGPSSVW